MPPRLVYPSSNSHEFCNFSAVSSPLLNSPQMVKLLVIPLLHLEALLFQEDQPCMNNGEYQELCHDSFPLFRISSSPLQLGLHGYTQKVERETLRCLVSVLSLT
ncbi:hypothetical protein AMTRI_Chr11g101880 [Amborella trichopoda]